MSVVGRWKVLLNDMMVLNPPPSCGFNMGITFLYPFHSMPSILSRLFGVNLEVGNCYWLLTPQSPTPSLLLVNHFPGVLRIYLMVV